MRRVLWVLGVFVIIGVLSLFVWYRNYRKGEAPGVFYPEQGRDHVSLTHLDTYNSNPPSSGGHYGTSANWGVYDYEVNDKIFLHNLEHGGVWIAYRPSVSPAVAGSLKSIAEKFSNYKIVMAPRSANDMDVAVVAWTRVYKFNLKNPAMLSSEETKAIEDFYYAWKDRGPEYVPGNMPGIDPKTVQ